MIGFNKPYISGKEFEYIKEAIAVEKLSGNGKFTELCHRYFERRYGFRKVLLTHSCTSALEMCSLLIDVKPGDEVIVPSYTFVSTANAFLLSGARIVFADSSDLNPNIDVALLESLITERTKAIVVVHYAGVACDMDAIMKLASRYGVYVVEDAAQAIDSFYKGRPLGGIGHLASFSFHETKNIISGEGGLLVVNDDKLVQRSEVIWEKGTNRSAFFRGEVDKYTWIDKGSSFLPSELTAAFLFAQLECLDQIQQKRKNIWELYWSQFQDGALQSWQLPFINSYATNNAHLFYLLCSSMQQRDALLEELRAKNIQAIFHYLPLHNSPYYKSLGLERPTLPRAVKYGDCVVRLPFYFDLSPDDVEYIGSAVRSFFRRQVAKRS